MPRALSQDHFEASLSGALHPGPVPHSGVPRRCLLPSFPAREGGQLVENWLVINHQPLSGKSDWSGSDGAQEWGVGPVGPQRERISGAG